MSNINCRVSGIYRFICILILLLIPISVKAHPGNTDSTGCHTCRTNCEERWGLEYGEYHCHNSKTNNSDNIKSDNSKALDWDLIGLGAVGAVGIGYYIGKRKSNQK